MASWEDGPEYAPLARPEQFAAPRVAPLDRAPEPPRPAADLPTDHPRWEQPRDAKPLDELVPDLPAARDPHQPFDAPAATLTTYDTAWGAAHTVLGDWAPPTDAPIEAAPGPAPRPTADGAAAPVLVRHDPNRPITLTRTREQVQRPGPEQPIGAQPGTPGWFGPGQWAPPAPQNPGLSLRSFVSGLSVPLLITLLAGGLILPLSPLFFVAAAICSRFVRYRRSWVRSAFIVCGAMLGTALIMGALFTAEVGGIWNILSWSSLFASWACLIWSSGLVISALRQHERPEARG
ncbi:hypothetical protein [Granulicoccus phenolivorans]|uniref:hypothetical protein n=1 Tax=Granulicoccus phenolivorans TaxID=266854 RepID=UPI000406BB17|nr:hypothetical protein [Granulicoccus phenolivorans]